jgi:ubiquinone/menaquinone biosynthesis C-methylase UbiE
MKEKAPETIYGVDFCQKMIQYSEEYLKDYQFKNKVKIIMADARSLPFKDNEFECVFTDSLFTHLKFTDAQQVANEIKRVASKNVITIERFVFDGEHPEPHVFSWDATKFLKLRVLEKKYIGQGLMGTVLEKKARE